MPSVTSNQPVSAPVGPDSVPTIWNTPMSLLGGYRQDYLHKAEAMQGFKKALAVKLALMAEKLPTDTDKFLDELDTLKISYLADYLVQLQHLVNNKWVKPGVGDRKAYVIKLRQLLLPLKNWLDNKEDKARQPFVQRFFSICKSTVADTLIASQAEAVELLKLLQQPTEAHMLHEFETCINALENELRNFKGAPEFLPVMHTRLSPQEVQRELDEVAQHRSYEDAKERQKEKKIKAIKATPSAKRKPAPVSDTDEEDRDETKKKKKSSTPRKPRQPKSDKKKKDDSKGVKFAEQLEAVKAIPTNAANQKASDGAHSDLSASDDEGNNTPPLTPTDTEAGEEDVAEMTENQVNDEVIASGPDSESE